MRPGTFGTTTNAMALDQVMSHISGWHRYFAEVLERRAFTDIFEKVLRRIYIFDGEPVTRKTDSEIEEERLLCTHHKESFEQVAREVYFYLKKTERVYKVWWAKVYVEVSTEINEIQKKEIALGHRTKANYGKDTKETIQNQILIKYEETYLKLNAELDEIKKTHDFLESTAKDMKERSISLAGIASNRKTY